MIVGSINTKNGVFLIGYAPNIEDLFDIIKKKYGNEVVAALKENPNANFSATKVNQDNARVVVECQTTNFGKYKAILYRNYLIEEENEMAWTNNPIASFNSLIELHKLETKNLHFIKWK